MSEYHSLAIASSSGQDSTSNTNQEPPQHPGGKLKRTLIESACTACRKRKSRCDGLRCVRKSAYPHPTCSRCQQLDTECRYSAEEGESRWSALRRKSKVFEEERNEMRELLDLMQSRPDTEAQDIFTRLRGNAYGGDIGALIRQAHEDATTGAMLRQQQQQEQPQQPDVSRLSSFGSLPPGPTAQLPPLRSVIDMPPSGSSNTMQQPLGQQHPAPRPAQRQPSSASILSTNSCYFVPSYDRQETH